VEFLSSGNVGKQKITQARRFKVSLVSTVALLRAVRHIEMDISQGKPVLARNVLG